MALTLAAVVTLAAPMPILAVELGDQLAGPSFRQHRTCLAHGFLDLLVRLGTFRQGLILRRGPRLGARQPGRARRHSLVPKPSLRSSAKSRRGSLLNARRPNLPDLHRSARRRTALDETASGGRPRRLAFRPCWRSERNAWPQPPMPQQQHGRCVGILQGRRQRRSCLGRPIRQRERHHSPTRTSRNKSCASHARWKSSISSMGTASRSAR
mmetsp:Transcript_24949/g.55355  ORF Transcript_24949/g.55355 Transcript_24949/m.55355 type:complete len:211 (+) Transcript_24949:171-803(+)